MIIPPTRYKSKQELYARACLKTLNYCFFLPKKGCLLCLKGLKYRRNFAVFFFIFTFLGWIIRQYRGFKTGSSVLYFCKGEGNESRLYASYSSDCKPAEIKAGRWCVCTHLPAFCPLRSKGISPSSFAPIFRHIWRFAEISNPFYYISLKLLCYRKKLLTFHAYPWYTHQTTEYGKINYIDILARFSKHSEQSEQF